MEMKDIQTKDLFQGVTDAIIGQIPVASFFLTAIDNVRNNILKRKFVEWQEMVEKRLSTLEKSVFSDLGNNETFATTLLKTSELAIQSSSKKNEYLANAVKYTAENNIDEDLLIIFLNLISKYSLAHIAVLKYFQEPSLYREENDDFPMPIINISPKLNYVLNDVVTNELHKDGLLKSNNCTEFIFKRNSIITGSNGTTKLGNQFLDFFGIKNV